MLHYVTLGSNDLLRSKIFYDATMAPLNINCTVQDSDQIGYGKKVNLPGERVNRLWLLKPYLPLPATWGNGAMVVFTAESHAQVDAFHAAALISGGVDEGAPGLRPFHANFYACYVRDPDGNKLSAVCEKPK